MNNVAIVVVTYNRKKLLIENLEMLFNQTYLNFDLYLIDNASTDGTDKVIKKYENKPNFFYINTGNNLGGAGGFNYGIKVIAEKHIYKYCWIMDDDTIPTSSALSNLINSAKKLNNNFSFLCSIVNYNDNEICLMNTPIIEKKWINDYKYIRDGLVNVKGCSFVSCFLNMDYVYKVGLPIKEFFIYYDDLEYTYRLSKLNKGYLDINSEVYHKMPSNQTVNVVNIDKSRIKRCYYTYRNKFYIEKKDGIKGIIKYSCECFLLIFKILFKSKNKKISRIKSVIKGYFAGMFFNPKIEKISNDL